MANRKQSPDWRVDLPLADLLKLKEQMDIVEQLRKDNLQLRRELNGLRNLYSDLLVRLEELRRDIW